MTVGELIEKLQRFEHKDEVVIEGCDCDGMAHDVEQLNAECVIITRRD